jgi:hypothetical protein
VASDSAVGIAAITINRAATRGSHVNGRQPRAIFRTDPESQTGNAAEIQARASGADGKLVTAIKNDRSGRWWQITLPTAKIICQVSPYKSASYTKKPFGCEKWNLPKAPFV